MPLQSVVLCVAFTLESIMSLLIKIAVCFNKIDQSDVLCIVLGISSWLPNNISISVYLQLYLFAILRIPLSDVDCLWTYPGGRDTTRSFEGPGEKHRSGYSTGYGWKYV